MVMIFTIIYDNKTVKIYTPHILKYKMKKLIQKIVNLTGYAITKKNFEKIYRTLDD